MKDMSWVSIDVVQPRRLLAHLAVAVLAIMSTTCASASFAVADEAPQAEFTGAYGYGIAVAMSADGKTAVVGQLGDSTSTDVPGVAHVFSFDGTNWRQQAELTASDPSYDMLFGNAVAVSADGDTVIVGDPGECGYGLDNCEHGAAYVFTRGDSMWTREAELNGGPGFGGAVALSGSGNTALVGAGMSGYYGNFYAIGGNAPPTLFERNEATWTQDTTLVASNALASFDNFGHAVALSADGDTALIGDPTVNGEAGIAYVFAGTGPNWTQQAELKGDDVATGWRFGDSVALSADGLTALVGAPAPDAGSAYVFSDSDSSWTQQTELTPNDEEVSSFDGWFGAAVALDGDGRVALVGAPWAEEDLGAAYAFAAEGSAWSQQAQFVLDNATTYDYFGDAVALDELGRTALIGRFDPGAYFFGIPPVHVVEQSGSLHEVEQPAPVHEVEQPAGVIPLDATTGAVQGPTTATPGHVANSVLSPKVVGEALSPTVFRAAARGASALSMRSRYGAIVTYALDVGSDVRFTVTRTQPGRDASTGRCVALSKANRGEHRCERFVAVAGGFTQTGKAGANQFRFTGRMAGRKLAAGSYQLIATPVAGSKVGNAATAPFRIAR